MESVPPINWFLLHQGGALRGEINFDEFVGATGSSHSASRKARKSSGSSFNGDLVGISGIHRMYM